MLIEGKGGRKMLTLAEQQRVKRIRRSLTKLHLQVTVSKGDHSPAELRMAVDNLCRVGEMLAGMHLLEDRKLPLQEIEDGSGSPKVYC